MAHVETPVSLSEIDPAVPEHLPYHPSDVYESHDNPHDMLVCSGSSSNIAVAAEVYSANVAGKDLKLETLSKICVLCQNLLDNFSFLQKHRSSDWSSTERIDSKILPFVYHTSTRSIQASADVGCCFCARIALSAINNNIHSELDLRIESLRLLRTPKVSWTIFLFFSGHIYKEMRLSVKLVPAPRLISPHNQTLASFCGTGRSLQQAKSWLHTCRNNHTLCKSVTRTNNPTRLVSTKTSNLHLVIGSQLPEPSNYASLSHCWGDAKFTVLQQSNIECFKVRIPAVALSKTFREAIKIARELGFDYIWIDSLCILQDVDEDWRHEAALMASVYGGSSLNIAASGAHDGNMGCFTSDKITSRVQVSIEVSGSIKVHECVPGIPYKMLHDMPLLRRGWVLQERLLSPRTLHFTSMQMFWECNQKVACETFPSGIPPEPHGLGGDVNARIFYEKQPVDLSMWLWIVEAYSACKLTHASDKFIALSGISREIQKKTGDVYVAGMWRKNLEQHLCWISQSKESKYPCYIAPSWSWMSINGPVRYYSQRSVLTGQTWIQIRNINITNVAQDTFGQISRGSLQLSCDFLLRGPKHGIGAKLSCLGMGGYFFPFTLIYDHHDFEHTESSRLLRKENNTDLVILMPITVRDSMTIVQKNTIETRSVYGLVLEATSEARGQYRRIGYFESFFAEAAIELIAPYEIRDSIFDMEVALLGGSIPVECKDEDYVEIFTDEAGKVRKVIELV